MAETTADVKRDIEMTRERISTTLAQLEQKTNVAQIVRDHPWPAIAAAVGVGVLLSGSRADVKAAGATVAATKGASSKLGGVLDEALASLMGGVHHAFQGHVDSIVEDVKKALGATNFGAIGTAGRVGGSGGDKVAKLMSGASGSPVTATPTSGAMAAGSGASGSSSGGGSWAPQTPDAVSAATVVSSNSVGGGTRAD